MIGEQRVLICFYVGEQSWDQRRRGGYFGGRESSRGDGRDEACRYRDGRSRRRRRGDVWFTGRLSDELMLALARCSAGSAVQRTTTRGTGSVLGNQALMDTHFDERKGEFQPSAYRSS